jgi:histone deacetylase 11
MASPGGKPAAPLGGEPEVKTSSLSGSGGSPSGARSGGRALGGLPQHRRSRSESSHSAGSPLTSSDGTRHIEQEVLSMSKEQAVADDADFPLLEVRSTSVQGDDPASDSEVLSPAQTGRPKTSQEATLDPKDEVSSSDGGATGKFVLETEDEALIRERGPISKGTSDRSMLVASQQLTSSNETSLSGSGGGFSGGDSSSGLFVSGGGGTAEAVELKTRVAERLERRESEDSHGLDRPKKHLWTVRRDARFLEEAFRPFVTKEMWEMLGVGAGGEQTEPERDYNADGAGLEAANATPEEDGKDKDSSDSADSPVGGSPSPSKDADPKNDQRNGSRGEQHSDGSPAVSPAAGDNADNDSHTGTASRPDSPDSGSGPGQGGHGENYDIGQPPHAIKAEKRGKRDPVALPGSPEEDDSKGKRGGGGIFGGLFGGGKKARKARSLTARLPIVYSPEYNISFMKLEKLHPFDSCKYKNVVSHLKMLRRDPGAFAEAYLITPSSEGVDPQFLKQIHTDAYLASLRDSKVVARITEVGPVAFLPIGTIETRLLKPFRCMVAGSIVAARVALQTGIGINLGGGFHHCSANEGGGFCAYADITAICTYLRAHSAVRNIAIVDFDAHQGNGHERDALKRREERGSESPRDTIVLDVYNQQIYPYDVPAMAGIDIDLPIDSGTGDDIYLSEVSYGLRVLRKTCLESWSAMPDLVIYNAGTDILENDPLGQLMVSETGVKIRDNMVRKLPSLVCVLKYANPCVLVAHTQVFQSCVRGNWFHKQEEALAERNTATKPTPVVMLLSGGYQVRIICLCCPKMLGVLVSIFSRADCFLVSLFSGSFKKKSNARVIAESLNDLTAEFGLLDHQMTIQEMDT